MNKIKRDVKKNDAMQMKLIAVFIYSSIDDDYDDDNDDDDILELLRIYGKRKALRAREER